MPERENPPEVEEEDEGTCEMLNASLYSFMIVLTHLLSYVSTCTCT